jgi:hypothetical protein
MRGWILSSSARQAGSAGAEAARTGAPIICIKQRNPIISLKRDFIGTRYQKKFWQPRKILFSRNLPLARYGLMGFVYGKAREKTG